MQSSIGTPFLRSRAAAKRPRQGGIVSATEPALHGRDTPSVVARIVAVLSAMAGSEAVVPLSEIARRTGLPKATVHRLLHQMADFGLVELSPGGARVGLRLFELGQLASGPRSVGDVAAPYLGDLHAATGHTVHLAVPRGTEVLYVHKIQNRRSPSVGSRVGGLMPMHCTAVGKALLAHAEPDVVQEALAAPLARITPRTIVAAGLIAGQLRRVRQDGIAEEHEESTLGVGCVAAPVLDARGRAVAAISVTGPIAAVTAARLSPAVRTAARGVARVLADESPSPRLI